MNISKKILFSINNLNKGGAEQLLISLLQKIDKNKYNPFILILNDANKFDNKNRFNLIPYNGHYRKIKQFWKIIKILLLIKKQNPDILHSHLYLSDFVSGLYKLIQKNKIVITTLHGYDTKRIHQLRIWHRIHFRIQNFLYSRFDHIVCVSKDLADYAKNEYKLDAKRISVIYNGLNNIDKYQRGALNKNCEGKLVFVGRLVPIKNIPLLINIMPRLPTKFTLTIIGDGVQKDELSELVLARNLESRIQFLDFSSHLNKDLLNYDILLLPSFHETFSIVTLEALLCGIPTLCTLNGGIKEIVTKIDSDLLFDPLDSDDLYFKLLRVASDYQMIRKKIFENFNFLSSFTIEKTYQAYSSLYDHLLNTKKYFTYEN